MCVQFYSFILAYCTTLRLSTFSNKRFIIINGRKSNPLTAKETTTGTEMSKMSISRKGAMTFLRSFPNTVYAAVGLPVHVHCLLFTMPPIGGALDLVECAIAGYQFTI